MVKYENIPPIRIVSETYGCDREETAFGALGVMWIEANCLVEEGVTSEDIDTACKLGLRHSPTVHTP